MNATTTPAAVVKQCCADLWSHPGIRLLAGEALHPGGTGLTRRAVAAMGLEPGATVLDAGSGPGTTLRLLAELGLRPVGLEYSPALALESSGVGRVVVGDAERPPFRPESMDGALMECVLSAIPDKRATLRAVAGLLRPGGSIAVSDVVVEGRLPDPLDSFAGWIACAAGAVSRDEYGRLLEGSGLDVVMKEDDRAALEELVGKARRRLALFRGALAAGLIEPDGVPDPGLVELGQELLQAAAGAIADGTLGYALIVGRKA